MGDEIIPTHRLLSVASLFYPKTDFLGAGGWRTVPTGAGHSSSPRTIGTIGASAELPYGAVGNEALP